MSTIDRNNQVEVEWLRELLKNTRKRRVRAFRPLRSIHHNYGLSDSWTASEEFDQSIFDRDNLHQEVSRNASFKHTFLPMNNLGLVTDSFRSHEMVQYLMDRSSKESNLYCKSGTLICVGRFDLSEWLHQNFKKYVMVTSTSAIGFKEFDSSTVRCEVSKRSGNLLYECHGDRDSVLKFSNWLSTQGFLEDEIYVRWAYGKTYQEMDTFDLPLMTLPKLESAYPWIKESVGKYAQDFQRSRESVLLMIGAPGTGKTTLVKELIKEMNTNALVTYDTELLLTDGFFASFISRDDTHVLIVEDADNLLSARKDGNTMMHRFLNASDGIVSLRHKKIIFTTNLPTINSVDSALLRAGRCFDILKFRNLTRDEALAVAKEMKIDPLPTLEKNEYNLAEITNWSKRTHGEEAVLSQVGFR